MFEYSKEINKAIMFENGEYTAYWDCIIKQFFKDYKSDYRVSYNREKQLESDKEDIDEAIDKIKEIIPLLILKFHTIYDNTNVDLDKIPTYRALKNIAINLEIIK